SVTFGYLQGFITESPHILEGKFGYWTNKLLTAQIGSTGVAALLIFAYLTVLILVYNLDLKWTWTTRKVISEEELEDKQEDNLDTFSRKNVQQNNIQQNLSENKVSHVNEPEEIKSETPAGFETVQAENTIKPNTSFEFEAIENETYEEV